LAILFPGVPENYRVVIETGGKYCGVIMLPYHKRNMDDGFE